MRKLIALLFTMLFSVSAYAETEPSKRNRLRSYLYKAGMPASRADLALEGLGNVRYYDTASELLAASPDEGAIGYAIDTNVFYFRSGTSWSGSFVLSGITGANGGTLDNDTNNAWIFGENSEDASMTFGTNTVTFASSTGATYIFTPAVALTGDLTVNGAAGALTFGAASSSIVVPDASATALVAGSAGRLDLLGLDSQDGLEKVIIKGTTTQEAFLVDIGDARFDEDVTVVSDLTVSGLIHPSPGILETFGYGALKGLATLQVDGTAFDGTAGVHNVAMLGENSFLYMPIIGQTIDLVMTATGMDISMDQTDNDGVEVFAGVLGASGHPYIIGTDAAFQSCVTFTITDGNGTDDFHIGFRLAETANGTIDSYSDRAGLAIVTVADPALVQIETELAGAGTTTTDTTDTLADATSTEWCILVDAAGAVTYTIDAAPPSATAAFSFADGTPVIPFIHLLQANVAQTGALDIENWEVGYQ